MKSLKHRKLKCSCGSKMTITARGNVDLSKYRKDTKKNIPKLRNRLRTPRARHDRKPPRVRYEKIKAPSVYRIEYSCLNRRCPSSMIFVGKSHAEAAGRVA